MQHCSSLFTVNLIVLSFNRNNVICYMYLCFEDLMLTVIAFDSSSYFYDLALDIFTTLSFEYVCTIT